jgi:putative hydrolase of the HAD superfamily
MNRYLAGECTFDEQRLQRMLAIFSRLGHDLPDAEAKRLFEQFLTMYQDAWQLYEDVLPTLEELKRCPLGILSNGNGEAQTKKLRRTGILPRFQNVVLSGDIGVAKPHPDSFGAVANQFRLPPSQIVYIGDQLETDALGAHRAGMRAVWLNRKNDETAPEPVMTIRTLREFLPRLQAEGISPPLS